MKYVIRGENVEVTKSIKDYIEDKLSKIDKYLENPKEIEAKVIASVSGINQRIEVTINGEKYFIRAEECHSDLYAAIDNAVDKLERQFRKYKTKLLDKVKKEEPSLELEDYFEDTKEEIVKRKKLFLKPMDEKEAITQMELLDHTFFVFKNVESGKISVVYKRKDGDYGILDVE